MEYRAPLACLLVSLWIGAAHGAYGGSKGHTLNFMDEDADTPVPQGVAAQAC